MAKDRVPNLYNGTGGVKIYRVSGLHSSGSASALARAITALEAGLKVAVDTENGLVDVHGSVNDYQVVDAIKKMGCSYLGVAGIKQDAPKKIIRPSAEWLGAGI